MQAEPPANEQEGLARELRDLADRVGKGDVRVDVNVHLERLQDLIGNADHPLPPTIMPVTAFGSSFATAAAATGTAMLDDLYGYHSRVALAGGVSGYAERYWSTVAL